MTMVSSASPCYCGSEKAGQAGPSPSQRRLVCQPCATRRLASQISRFKSETEKRERKREECRRRLLETRLPPAPVDGSDAPQRDEGTLSSRRPLPDPTQINQRVSQLRQRLDALRSQSNDLAVRVTAKTVENDSREEQLRTCSAKVQLGRERLDRMTQCLLMQSTPGSNAGSPEGKEEMHGGIGGGLKDALVSGTQQIQALRFHFACKVFDMHRLDVGEQYSKQVVSRDGVDSKKGNESPTGVGKIGGLPLPHAGPVLYGVIPPVVLSSSLRMVASLTQMVARCLGVVLPHPILVCSKECKCGNVYDYAGDVIDATCTDESDGEDENDTDQSRTKLCDACRQEGTPTATVTATERRPQLIKQSSDLSSSSVPSQRRSSLLSFVGSSARKAIAITSSATSRAITHMHQSSSSMDSVQRQPSLNPSVQNAHSNTSESNKNRTSSASISTRINRASFAYLRENYDTIATEYVLNPPRWNEEGNGGNKANEKDSFDGSSDSRQSDATNKMQGQSFSTREEFHVAEERFATGMQLLQNDVVALCFRAGVDVKTLWPAESILLNLHSLWCHCQKMAASSSP
ncbi:hypothetical protein ACHAWF_013823 [Thalassiosira exigua]